MTKEKKGRVLHTRIPESLDAEIRSRAERLGISVSNLVRNVLQNTAELVDEVVADVSRVAQSAAGHGAQGEAYAAVQTAEYPKILGWQELVLEINAVCVRCNDILRKGTAAHLAVGPQPPVFRCERCMKEERHDNDAIPVREDV